MLFKASHQDHHWEIQVGRPGPTLLELLHADNVPIRSACMGKGTCHQCRIRVTAGVAPPSETDKKVFSAQEIVNGWRLSCCLRPRTPMTFSFPLSFTFKDVITKIREPSGPWKVLCDFGTTNIDCAFADAKGVWATARSLNQQVLFGADIMTRLEYAQRNGLEPLKTKGLEQIQNLIQAASKHASAQTPFDHTVLAAGNSAVTSFLADMPIDTLAVMPFQPHTLAPAPLKTSPFSISFLPLLYSFVGGDLFADLFALWDQGLAQSTPWLLVDIGTNSEILCWDGEKLFISSTPAGPAFEGSNISIGMRADKGAILHAQFQQNQWRLKTVDDDLPVGICGTGLIEALSSAVNSGLLKEDGELTNPKALCFQPDLCLSQWDVREFQLAKSAIQTGIELVAKSGKNHPKKLYIAGAFGQHLPIESCHRLGMLPPWPTQSVGNACLDGLIRWSQATEATQSKFTKWVKDHATPIDLALRDDFQDAFIRNMSLKSH